MELLLAIDAGLDSGGQDFIEALKQLNRLPGEVRALLITHWHNGHAAGAAALKEKLDARIYYAQGEAPFLTRGTAKRGFRLTSRA